MISINDFEKINLKTAKIVSADRVDGSDKLIKIELEVGEKTRQIVAGIGKKYEPEEIVGKTIIIVANLEPRMLMGLESQGMLLAARDNSDNLSLLTVMDGMDSGSSVG